MSKATLLNELEALELYINNILTSSKTQLNSKDTKLLRRCSNGIHDSIMFINLSINCGVGYMWTRPERNHANTLLGIPQPGEGE